MKIGTKYRLVHHPKQPIGKLISIDYFTDEGTVEWDDKGLIPPSQKYPIKAFKDGTFEELANEIESFVGGDKSCWRHFWISYVGFREKYDYCSNCGMRRYKG